MTTRKDTILERLARIETKIDTIKERQATLSCASHSKDILLLKRDRKWVAGIVGIIAAGISGIISLAMEYLKRGI